jgi:hypothetical protein
MNSLRSKIYHYTESQIPRVLTQLDRDPDSPTYGCFDRNYWHYKIRDFPSSILQQGIFTLEALRKGIFSIEIDQELINNWCKASINALLNQADRRGGLNEYYPYEDSYPAMAFSLYTACKVIQEWKQSDARLLDGLDWNSLNKIAEHHAKRIETEAANQEATGLAGLAYAHHLGIGSIQKKTVEHHAETLFGLQDEEGWFREYGGPDFGYLTVTIDALSDYFEITGDERAINAINRAIDFIALCVGADGLLPSTVNSRNTDYVVPYGLSKWASKNSTASWLLNSLFKDLDQPFHFIRSTDDRYHTHYIFASMVRSIGYLDDITEPVEPVREANIWMPNCGYRIFLPKHRDWSVIVAARKGGVMRIHLRGGRPIIDNGWRFYRDDLIWTSNWWSEDPEIEEDEKRISIKDVSRQVHYFESKPYKHILLRLLAWFFRGKLIPLLKQKMIFRSGEGNGPDFRRTVSLVDDSLHLQDEFISDRKMRADPSPRHNNRHVASADSFSIEEWGESVSRESVDFTGYFECRVTISLSEVIEIGASGIESS